MHNLLNNCMRRTWGTALIAMAVAALLNGCSTSSVLIRPDDPTFMQSQERMQRTIILVEESKPNPAERALFLQGESFYRYRFEPPAHSTMSYLAEAAAVITDFPAFQSLAGSLDLVDLRLRASDSHPTLGNPSLSISRDDPSTPDALSAGMGLSQRECNRVATTIPGRGV